MQTLTSASSVSRSDSCTTDSRSSSLVIFDVKWVKFSAPPSSRPVLLWQSNTSTYLATTVVSNFSDNKPPSQLSPLNNPQSTLPFCEMFCLCFARSPLCQACSPASFLSRILPCQEKSWKALADQSSPCQESFANFLNTRLVHKCHTGHRNSWQIWNHNIWSLFCLLFIAFWTERAHQNCLHHHYHFCYLLWFDTCEHLTSSYCRNPTRHWRWAL